MEYAVLGVIAVLAIFVVSVYNKIVKQKLVVEEATGDIETFLKQRYDMIPNLVEIVKGYAKHESETFKQVTEMRAKAMSAGSLDEKMETENQITQALSKIIAIAENYPELKANTNFQDLQNSLKELEDNLQKSRRFYNGTARDYNSMIVVFPQNLLAGIFGFKKVSFFEAGEEEKKNVEIKF